MKKVFGRTLIVCPHADDELFTFGLVFSKENLFKNIDLLLIGCNTARKKETFISSKINKFNLIYLPKDIKCIDSFYHLNFESLKEYFLKNLINYDLVLSPLIEGGHQDHDTVTAALLRSKERAKFKAKILLYSTYRSMNTFPNLFRCGIPKGLFNDQRYFFEFTLKGLKTFVKTILIAYKSQYLTWIVLFPFLFLAYISRELNSMVDADNLSFENILKMSPKKPLYQTYRSLERSHWLKYIQD